MKNINTNKKGKQLKEKQMSIQMLLEPQDHRRIAALCGQFNSHIASIEKQLQVDIHHRGCRFDIIGSSKQIKQVRNILNQLYHLTEKNKELSIEQVQEAIDLFTKEYCSKQNVVITDEPCLIKTQQAYVKAKTKNQQCYLQAISDNDINFGIGPSGTGKTFLAVAMAAQALENNEVKRLILVRPAVEAGERLGFLPGDLSDKVDPYLRPLYDALYFMLGAEKVNKLIEKNIIEVAPLAYMRGRTLNDAFIILDESQNTTPEQMKMLLTRIGFGSKAVITGDVTQIDLPKHINSGLRHAKEVLKNIPSIHFTFFVADDVVRHPLVQKIIYAYERHENND